MSSPSATIRVWICQTATRPVAVVALPAAVARPAAAAVARPLVAAAAARQPVRPVAAQPVAAVATLPVAPVAPAAVAGCEAARPPQLHLRSFPTNAS